VSTWIVAVQMERWRLCRGLARRSVTSYRAQSSCTRAATRHFPLSPASRSRLPPSSPSPCPKLEGTPREIGASQRSQQSPCELQLMLPISVRQRFGHSMRDYRLRRRKGLSGQNQCDSCADDREGRKSTSRPDKAGSSRREQRSLNDSSPRKSSDLDREPLSRRSPGRSPQTRAMRLLGAAPSTMMVIGAGARAQANGPTFS
jgi:hypothetical protein